MIHETKNANKSIKEKGGEGLNLGSCILSEANGNNHNLGFFSISKKKLN
jgi:hypothetical protein